MPSLRRVLPASTFVDLLSFLIFFAIFVFLFSIGPSGALPAYMQVASQCPLPQPRTLTPLNSVVFFPLQV